MPRFQMGDSTVHLLEVETYQPGDLPPEGYLEWHEWADVQRKAGIEQAPCVHCRKWKTPQELSGEQPMTIFEQWCDDDPGTGRCGVCEMLHKED